MQQAVQLPAPEAAELHYVRMCRLRRMSPGELHAALSGEPAEAAGWTHAAARYGIAPAQLRFGQMLLDGRGVEQDEARALGWFRRAARAGSVEAMNMVGRCLENGWGTPLDLVASARCYRCAAEAEYDWGEYNFANMLFDGRGVARDQVQAVAWYRRAARQGHARAMNLLARCCEEGWGAPVDRREAFDWFRRSAQAGYFRAQFNLGTLLAEQGRVAEARSWLARALDGREPGDRRPMTAMLARHRDRRLAELAARVPADEEEGSKDDRP